MELGWNRVVPPLDPYSIQEALLDKEVNHPCQPPSDLYGGGHAVERIAQLLHFLAKIKIETSVTMATAQVPPEHALTPARAICYK